MVLKKKELLPTDRSVLSGLAFLTQESIFCTEKSDIEVYFPQVHF